MRRIWITLPLLALAAACGADAQQAGVERGQRNFTVGDFQSLALAGPHDVIVTVGGAPSVRAEGDAQVLERLDIKVEGGTLRIGTQRSSSFSFGRGRGAATIHVTVPTLAAASIGGSGDLRIDRVDGERFEASIGGSGDMQIGRLRAREAQFSVAGSGSIRASGSVQRERISIAGSGDVDVSALEARSAAISIVGSGNVRGRATESAEISVMGSGDVSIAGPARCAVNRMGSGDVRCNL